MKKFKVGKRYKIDPKASINKLSYEANETLSIRADESFECHHVDEDGDCWSMDVEFLGETCDDGIGWCAATSSDLSRKLVLEVK